MYVSYVIHLISINMYMYMCRISKKAFIKSTNIHIFQHSYNFQVDHFFHPKKENPKIASNFSKLTTSWWFQPNIKKQIVKLDHFPQKIGMNIKKNMDKLKPPPLAKVDKLHWPSVASMHSDERPHIQPSGSP